MGDQGVQEEGSEGRDPQGSPAKAALRQAERGAPAEGGGRTATQDQRQAQRCSLIPPPPGAAPGDIDRDAKTAAFRPPPGTDENDRSRGYAFWACSPNAAPCGSKHEATMSPPGTSIGPFVIFPPRRRTASVA